MEDNTKKHLSNWRNHAFSANPLTVLDRNSSLARLRSFLCKTPEQLKDEQTVLILPFLHSKPLVLSPSSPPSPPTWRLAWQSLYKCVQLVDHNLLSNMVYLGHRGDTMHWALDFPTEKAAEFVSSTQKTIFVDVRRLMIGTDPSHEVGMADLSIAGQAKALLEWHDQVQFCCKCGTKALFKEDGRKKQCGNNMCKRNLFPRIDAVVIMLVIDKVNNRALLARQSQFLSHMWSCLAGFIEPGESLEEAMKREIWEEVGIEINEAVYHSSQPWPVGPVSMPCQLMVGFFAFAKSFEILVDQIELEDAQWFSREEVKKMLDYSRYKKDQKKTAFRINQLCAGAEMGKGSLPDIKRNIKGSRELTSITRCLASSNYACLCQDPMQSHII
ncbi:hypothetical protein SUGI_0610860 [Cryptomeria japonica]|nr:hypothetical protein SUGI_0610860 [Cryptomeria japonica]